MGEGDGFVRGMEAIRGRGLHYMDAISGQENDGEAQMTIESTAKVLRRSKTRMNEKGTIPPLSPLPPPSLWQLPSPPAHTNKSPPFLVLLNTR